MESLTSISASFSDDLIVILAHGEGRVGINEMFDDFLHFSVAVGLHLDDPDGRQFGQSPIF
jgi:hypothetical protein